jgi:hypothetical protein
MTSKNLAAFAVAAVADRGRAAANGSGYNRF